MSDLVFNAVAPPNITLAVEKPNITISPEVANLVFQVTQNNVNIQVVKPPDLAFSLAGATGQRGLKGDKGDTGSAGATGAAAPVGTPFTIDFVDDGTLHQNEIVTVVHNLGTKFFQIVGFDDSYTAYDGVSFGTVTTALSESFDSSADPQSTGTYTIVDENTIKMMVTYGTTIIQPSVPPDQQAIDVHDSLRYAILYAGQRGINGTSSGLHRGNVSSTTTPDGTETVFTVPEAYIAGTLEVKLNGVFEGYVTELTATTFSFSTAPLAGDIIKLAYNAA